MLADAAASCPKVKTWVAYTATEGAPPIPEGFTAWEDVIAGQSDQPPEVTSDLTPGAAMIYTSGTTGKPKGAMRTATDPALTIALLNELNYLHPDGVHLTTGPLYHSGPLAFASVAMQLAHPVVIMRRFDAATWVRLVGEHRVTNTFTAPTQLKRIVSLPDDVLAQADLSSMVTLIANAAPVPYALKQELIAKLGDGWLYEVYGSTELGVDCVLRPEDQLRKPGSCGKPYGSIQIRIVGEDGATRPTGEAGELFVRSTMVMDGYHRTSEELAHADDDGGDWHSVGDIAYVDEEGYVHICDRKKDMIISGGMNIYPAEIEAALEAHADVLEAAVFGIPSEEWGETVHAIVVVREGAKMTEDQVSEHARAHLANYKVPRSITWMDELPKTGSGKILKRELRAPFWAGRTSKV